MGKVSTNSYSDERPIFLHKNINFLALIAVLFTTLFGWFNPNSWCIILLVVCRLLDGKPVTNIKTAFANRLFIVYFLLFLIGAAGYLYGHDLATQGKVMSKECTLVAVAFVFCAGSFADQPGYRKLITSYSLLLLASSVYCLFVAWRNYLPEKNTNYFFYHTLTAPISQNAVFYSVYVLFGIVFLLSPYGEPVIGPLPRRGRQSLRYGLLLFFLGMMVLLSSRLMLVIMVLILAGNFLRRYSFRKDRATFLIAGSLLLVAVGLLAVHDNPIRWRFREMADGDMTFVHRDKFNPDTHFSSLDSRLVQWRFAVEILNARHAWLFGVSPGDSQDLLDQKYVAAHMYVGNPADGPNRHIRGYLGFNFHDQYIETLARSGLVGLASLLAVFVALFAAASSAGVREAWIVILTLAIFFVPEAPLTLQHGVFLFCFFPLLALNRPGPEKLPAKNS